MHERHRKVLNNEIVVVYARPVQRRAVQRGQLIYAEDLYVDKQLELEKA